MLTEILRATMIVILLTPVLWGIWRATRKRPEPNLLVKMSAVLIPEEAKELIMKACGWKCSADMGEQLTAFELHWLLWRLMRNLPACIDCEAGELGTGPAAGISTNLMCLNPRCGSKFNALLGAFSFARIDRISDRSPKLPREMLRLGEYR